MSLLAEHNFDIIFLFVFAIANTFVIPVDRIVLIKRFLQHQLFIVDNSKNVLVCKADALSLSDGLAKQKFYGKYIRNLVSTPTQLQIAMERMLFRINAHIK